MPITPNKPKKGKKDNHKPILSHKANDHIQHIKNKNHRYP